ncbi:uncharacterized protein M421DRAFT_10839 [Didymella exigua CBS 183.55]|uniref:Uncharacterized protein n=1 Tax=Didymella exigua CBS 183.55 TaxID=1150837 RepID=A0A6A5R3Z6_9PLEO|nr:uncharacterized protein M421DRAFT_10839 [Didymella exigua CBS 183.55]KAF1922109.1 hypothetical protein M421DRAFT_10839 [Didymella exigua CBS 183.55]
MGDVQPEYIKQEEVLGNLEYDEPEYIKQEEVLGNLEYDEPEDIKQEEVLGDLEPDQPEIPPHFKPNEWIELTEGALSLAHEIQATLAARGQSGTKRGRRTHTKVQFKGPLSESHRAKLQ